MARITESQLRSIIKQELKGLLESFYDDELFNIPDEPYGLAIEFGDYDCIGMKDAIMTINNTPDTSDNWYPGKNNGFTKEQIIQFLNNRRKLLCKNEKVVTFTVKQHAKSHYGVGIVETVGTYNSFEEAVEVAKQGNRYIVSSEGKQFFPKYDF